MKKLTTPILLFLTILVSFAPLYLLGGFIGDFGDPIGQTIPNKFLLIEYIKNGIFPLWNSFSFLGSPFLADIQVGAFYLPDIAIFSVFSPTTAHNISILVHLVFAGIGTYLFANQITKNKIVAFSSSIMLILGGAFLTKIVYLNFLETISFLPWILFIITLKKNHIWLLSILFALMIFAGHPIAFFYSLIIIFTFFLINKIGKWKAIIPSLLISLFLASIQIIPFLQLKANSVRDSLSYEQFIEGSLSFKGLLGFITPFKHGMQNPFDFYIHFGIIGFLLILISVFFFRNFNKKDKRIYLTGGILCIFGILLSLGGNIPPLAKLLHELPILNLIRVPARYMILFHFGALLMVTVFLKYIITKNKKLGTTVAILIIINSLLLPSIFLNRHEIGEAKKEYFPEIRASLEEYSKTEFSLYTPPKYFLSSSFYLFPNRHVLNLMPNVIGYNPMISKNFHNTFPVAPVGAFTDPDYLKNIYAHLEEIGLKYYIFPNEAYLKEKKLEEKKHTIDFLRKNKWVKIVSGETYDIWESPFKKDSAYFQNKSNTIEKLEFSPGKIKIELTSETSDLLIINQSFNEGWKAITNKSEIIPVEQYRGYLQSYQIPKNINTLTIVYNPKEIITGMYLSILGIILLLITLYHETISYRSRR